MENKTFMDKLKEDIEKRNSENELNRFLNAYHNYKKEAQRTAHQTGQYSMFDISDAYYAEIVYTENGPIRHEHYDFPTKMISFYTGMIDSGNGIEYRQATLTQTKITDIGKFKRNDKNDAVDIKSAKRLENGSVIFTDYSSKKEEIDFYDDYYKRTHQQGDIYPAALDFLQMKDIFAKYRELAQLNNTEDRYL